MITPRNIGQPKLWHFFVPWHVDHVAWRCLPEEMVSSSHALWTLCVLTWQVSPARLYHQNVIWPWWLRGRLNTTYRRHGLRLGTICWWICCQTKDWIMEHVIMCQWYVPFCVECLLCVWKGEGRFSSRFLIVIPVETMLLVYSTCSCLHVCDIYLYIYIYILYAPCTWFHCFVLEEKFFPTQFYCTGVWCLTEGDVESTKMCASLRISKVSIAQGAFEGFYFSAVACLMTQIKL